MTSHLDPGTFYLMTNTKKLYRVVVRSAYSTLISSTNAMPEGRARAIARKMASGEQYDPDSEMVLVEPATADNAPDLAIEGWAAP